MLNPAIGKLIKAYKSRYQLVVDVAKYARVISEEAERDKVILDGKPVELALNALCERVEREAAAE